MTAYQFLGMLNKEDQQFRISKTEFLRIKFPNEWPMLIRDIAKELSGVDFLKGNVISEADEHPDNKYSS